MPRLPTCNKNASELNPDALKSLYLTGLGGYLIDPTTGEGFTDLWYQHHIDLAIINFEDYTQVHIMPTEVVAEKHDYRMNDYMQFAFMTLYEAPVMAVTKFDVVYPTNVAATTFPVEWVKYQGASQIQLVPTAGTLANIILGRGGAYLPLIYEGGLGFLPQLFHVSYTAGFHRGLIPLCVFDAVMKMAAIEVLEKAGDLVYGPGVSSISSSFDGISMSRGVSNPLFQSRIESMKLDLYGTSPMSNATCGELARIKNIYFGLPLYVT